MTAQVDVSALYSIKSINTDCVIEYDKNLILTHLFVGLPLHGSHMSS